MAWAEKVFKGKDTVWVLVDDAGDPIVDQGRVSMRYSNDEAAKVYNAAAVNISDERGQSKPKKRNTKGQQSLLSFDDQIWTNPVGPMNGSDEKPDELMDIEDPDDDEWVFHTDGACSGNPGPCGWGWLLRQGSDYYEANQYIGVGTNNIAELMAILTALEHALDLGAKTATIHTDSNLSIGLLTQGWKAKKNKELVAATREVIDQFEIKPTFIKVKGHSGDPLNDRADFLATSAIPDRS